MRHVKTFESFNYPKNRKQDTQTKIMDVFDDIKVSYDDFEVTTEFEEDTVQLSIKIPERLSPKELESFYDQEISEKIKQLESVYGIRCVKHGFFSRTIGNIGNIGSSWIVYKSMHYHRDTDKCIIDIKFHRF